MIRLFNKTCTTVVVKPEKEKPFNLNAKSYSDPLPESEISDIIRTQIAKNILREDEVTKVKIKKVVPPKGKAGKEGGDDE